MERPEEREFATDLHIDVPRRRAELVSAALTIVRAYIAAVLIAGLNRLAALRNGAGSSEIR